jgi:PAS domain S-box-containing protein
MITKEDYTILVVDDDPLLLEATARIFRKSGYMVLTAVDGTSCMELLNKVKPDIILLDMILPDIGGQEVCKQIKSNPVSSSVYIILISSLQISSDSVSEGLEGGADDYVRRPLANRELLAKVQAACRIVSAERTILKNEMLLKACINSPNDMIVLAIDNNFNYLAFNNYHREIMQKAYGVDIKLGMNLIECMQGEEDIRRAKINYSRAMQGESHITIEEYGDLNRNYYETRYNPIFNEHNRIIGATAFSADVTERKRIENSLKKSEEKFRKAFVTSPDSININRLSDGMYVSVNEGFTKIMGYSEEEVIGKTSVEMDLWADPSDRDRLVRELNAAGRVENLEARFISKSGSLLYGIMSASLIDFDGVKHILSITRDISYRKTMEDALKKSEARYRALVEMSPDGILLGSHYGVIIDANNVFLKIAGRRSDELLGKNINLLFSEVELKSNPLRYDLLKQGEIVASERIIKRPDGSVVYIEMRTGMMPDGTYQSVWHDITKRKLAEEALKVTSDDLRNKLEEKRKTEKALKESFNKLEISKLATLNLLEDIKVEMEGRRRVEEEVRKLNTELELRVIERTQQFENANKELEAFAYSVSHDLRAPLRAIDGFSKFILEDHSKGLDDEGQRLFGLIRQNTNKMDQLITDILALSRISRNELKRSAINMSSLVMSMYSECIPQDDRSNFKIVLSAMPDAYADPAYLKQVWTNLISNAVKFSSNKTKPLIKVGGYTENNFNIYFIKDNGAGFNQEFEHRLFGVFQRLHSPDEFEGTGIGLAIVQRIIHRHGGKVWAEGKENKGATFWFSLPLKKQVC